MVLGFRDSGAPKRASGLLSLSRRRPPKEGEAETIKANACGLETKGVKCMNYNSGKE